MTDRRWSDPRLSPHHPPRLPGDKPRNQAEAAADLDAALARLGDALWDASRLVRGLAARLSRKETE